MDRVRWALGGSEGACGRVVLSWTLFGGIFGGGLLISAHALAGRGTPGLHLLLAPVLFLLGTALGTLHGIALSLLGRARDEPRGDALRRAGIGAGAGLLLLPVGWLVSAAIVVGVALQAEVRVSWIVVSAGGTLVGLMVGAWAFREGWTMVSNALGHVRQASVEASPPARGADAHHPPVR